MEKYYPPFVNMSREGHPESFTSLRYLGQGIYYRDGGDWKVGTKFVDDILLTVDIYADQNQLDGQVLEEVTEEEWRKDNAQYAPVKLVWKVDHFSDDDDDSNDDNLVF